MMVSTRMKELVSRFCIATGKASFSAMRQKPISPKYFLNMRPPVRVEKRY